MLFDRHHIQIVVLLCGCEDDAENVVSVEMLFDIQCTQMLLYLSGPKDDDFLEFQFANDCCYKSHTNVFSPV